MTIRFSNFYFTENNLQEGIPGLRALGNLFRRTKKIGLQVNWLKIADSINLPLYIKALDKLSSGWQNKTKFGKKKNIFIKDLKMGEIDDLNIQNVKNKIGEFESDERKLRKTYHIPVYQLSNGGKFILFNMPKEGAPDSSKPEDQKTRIYAIGMDGKANKVFEQMFGMTYKDWKLLKGKDNEEEKIDNQSGSNFRRKEITKKEFQNLVPELKESLEERNIYWDNKDKEFKSLIGNQKVKPKANDDVVDKESGDPDRIGQEILKDLFTSKKEKPKQQEPSKTEPEKKPESQSKSEPTQQEPEPEPSKTKKGKDKINKKLSREIKDMISLPPGKNWKYVWKYELNDGGIIYAGKSQQNKYQLFYNEKGLKALRKNKLI